MPDSASKGQLSGDEGNGQKTKSNTILTTPTKRKDEGHFLTPHPFLVDDQATIVSPSKARAEAQRSHEIALIDSWLESLFAPSPVPTQFREWKQELPSSKEVLKALQDLQYANNAADKLNSLLHQARIDEIATLQNLQVRAQQSPSDELLIQIQNSLSVPAQAALTSLIGASNMLGMPVSLSHQEPHSHADSSDVDLITKLGRLISCRTRNAQSLGSNISSLQVLHVVLQNQLSALERALESQQEKQTSEQNMSEHLHAETAQHNREAKQIAQKIAEYRDRIAQLEQTLQNLSKGFNQQQGDSTGTSNDPKRAVSVGEILAYRDDVESRKHRVEQLEQRVAAFHGLPPDLNVSRKEVKRSTAELANLQRRREELFEKLARR